MIKLNLAAKLAAAGVAGGLVLGGAGVAVAVTAASTVGPYYPQGTIVDLCIGAADQVYAEAGRDAGILGSCAGGYTQLPVAADPDGFAIQPPGSGTSTDVVTVTSPGTQDSTEGDTVSLAMIAVSSQDHPISSWSVTGQPPGLAINASGVISGTITASGTFTVTATATDSVATVGSVTFDWVVNA